MKTLLNSFEQEYRETELGFLPPNWSVKKIGESFEISKKPKELKISDDEEIVFVSMDKISDSNKASMYEFKKYSNVSSGIFVQKGDLIVAKITPCFENGKQAVLDNIPRDFAVATTEVIPIHSKNNGEALVQYLQYYLRLQNVRKELESKMEGTTGRKRLPKTVLCNTTIALPPVSEQNKIIFVLCTIQAAKEKSENAINALKELKKSLMKHLFTYGSVSLKDTDGVSLKDTEIGEIPQNWKIKTLGEINKEKTKNIDPLKHRDDLFEYYSIPAYQDHKKPIIIQGSKILSQKKLLKEGMTLFGKLNPRVEKVWRVKNYSKYQKIGSGEWITISANPEEINVDYLFYLQWSRFVMPVAKTMVTGSTPSRQRVDPTSFYKTKVPIPSFEEQEQIALILSSVDSRIDVENRIKESTNELFKSILNSLMNAKIRANVLEA